MWVNGADLLSRWRGGGDLVCWGVGSLSLPLHSDSQSHEYLPALHAIPLSRATEACENNCHGNGECVEGKCSCHFPYTPPDCDLCTPSAPGSVSRYFSCFVYVADLLQQNTGNPYVDTLSPSQVKYYTIDNVLPSPFFLFSSSSRSPTLTSSSPSLASLLRMLAGVALSISSVCCRHPPSCLIAANFRAVPTSDSYFSEQICNFGKSCTRSLSTFTSALPSCRQLILVRTQSHPLKMDCGFFHYLFLLAREFSILYAFSVPFLHSPVTLLFLIADYSHHN